MIRSWLEFDVMRAGTTHWQRLTFVKRRDCPVSEHPTNPEFAREMMISISWRWKHGARFRLVRVTEEVLEPEFENFHNE